MTFPFLSDTTVNGAVTYFRDWRAFTGAQCSAGSKQYINMAYPINFKSAWNDTCSVETRVWLQTGGATFRVQIQGSMDGIKWNILGTGSDTNGDSTSPEITNGVPLLRYMRAQITPAGGDGSGNNNLGVNVYFRSEPR